MHRIERQGPNSAKLAKGVLSWITCAKRQLTTSELQHALAVQAGEPEFNKEDLPQVQDMISVCAGLVTVNEESDIIRLIHYTTQEYFEGTWKDWFPDAETTITKICITYLSFNIFERGSCQTLDEFKERLKLNPLYEYAAKNWGHHAGEASVELEQLTPFFKFNNKVSASYQTIILGNLKNSRSIEPIFKFFGKNAGKGMEGIHLAAYFGLEVVTTALLSGHGAGVRKTCSAGRTPLSYAAENGHEVVVKLLLAKEGIDVNSGDNVGQTPLLHAVYNGHEAVVKLLLAKEGIDVNSRDENGGTPLSLAAENGHKVVVKLLLAKEGIDVNSRDEDRGTPLSLAAENGHEAVIKLLLAKEGIDVNSRDNFGQTPLSYAADNGHKAVVELLRQSGTK